MSTDTATPDSIPEDKERELTEPERRYLMQRIAPAPIDAAMMNAPIGQPQRYLPRLRTGTLATRPPISLEAASIEGLPGFEEHGTHVAEGVDALKAMHDVMTRVIDGRNKSMKDPTLNEAAQVLAVDALVTKLMPAATAKADNALRVIEVRIKAAEAELRTGIESSSGYLSAMASEVRAHCKDLTTPTARIAFVNELIEADDRESLAAVLRGKPFLSGLTQEQQDLLTQKWNIRRNPALPQRIELLKKARDHIERIAPRFPLLMEEAMGVDYKTLQRLRAAKKAASF